MAPAIVGAGGFEGWTGAWQPAPAWSHRPATSEAIRLMSGSKLTEWRAAIEHRGMGFNRRQDGGSAPHSRGKGSGEPARDRCPGARGTERLIAVWNGSQPSDADTILPDHRCRCHCWLLVSVGPLFRLSANQLVRLICARFDRHQDARSTERSFPRCRADHADQNAPFAELVRPLATSIADEMRKDWARRCSEASSVLPDPDVTSREHCRV